MKTFVKHFLPELHVNPIHRDLLLVVISGLLIALAIATVTTLISVQL